MSEGNGKPRVATTFLGMPGYGRMTAAAGRSFWRACRDMNNVVLKYQQGSLLAHNFNALWCAALNAAHRGQSPRYFAMLHDDIGAEDWWLDKLIVEMEARDLDVLGVVVPIKDSRGLTSLALHQEGDNWRPKCRLSMCDVYRLPATFTSDDVGAPLLLNTGCWVCKFDMEWARKVHFEINDCVAFNTKTNQYQALNESEDWYFSRLLHELKLKVGATRKVRVVHRGELDFMNDKPWGNFFFDADSSLGKSPVPDVDRDGFRFPYDCKGWLAVDEGKELFRLARDKRVLEIGSYCGCSTICLAQSAVSVTAVDTWDGRLTPEPRDTLDEFNRNLSRYGLLHKVFTQRPEDELSDTFDLAFIDGAHDMDAVRADIARCLAVLAPGGRLVFHDYGNDDTPGVAEAVNELLAAGGEVESVTETLAVVRPPAAVLSEV